MTAATEYALHNKVIDQVLQEPGRFPPPQVLSTSTMHGIQQNRILHDHSPGYEAPKFEGKEKQMEQGELYCIVYILHQVCAASPKEITEPHTGRISAG